MIIDTEWGGFGDRGEAEYIFTQYDKIIDARSDHPGVNSLDKLVAGMCMGEVVRLVLNKLCNHKYNLNVKNFSSDDCGSYSNTRQIMDELAIEDFTFSDMLLFREVCLVVSRRSANLSAAVIGILAIACVLNRVRKAKMTVAIDGSTYKYHPFFDHWVTEKIKELIDPGIEVGSKRWKSKKWQCVLPKNKSGWNLFSSELCRQAMEVKKKEKEEEARIKLETEERERRQREEENRLRGEEEEREKDKKMEEERARIRSEQLYYEDERRREEEKIRSNLLED
uniref:Phosphotransferase n=1 Tax=Heterorhabditis bacteriophora TaxID=37862 RepID=A0A1I7WRU9_HETBA